MKSLPLTIGLFLASFLFSLSSLFAHDHEHDRGANFISNQGQWPQDFSHKASFGNLVVFAEKAGFTYLLHQPVEHYNAETGEAIPMPESINAHAFKLNFHNANAAVYEGRGKKTAYHNYFLGNDRSKWKSKVPLYKGIYAKDIYAGIDVHAYGDGSNFKYDFEVAPGANAEIIRFSYSGLDAYQVKKGSIILKTSLGDLIESIPVSYQMINGERIEVLCEYRNFQDGIGFSFPDGYDSNYELIIDPVLVGASLTGTTSGTNYGHGAAFDIAGNIYTHGISFDSQYPTDEGSFQQAYGGGGTDVCLSKLTPDASELIFATFIGGNGGDSPHSIVTNGNLEVFVFGSTNSTDFPVTPNAVQPEFGGSTDIFITGISDDGTEAVGSTYLGGSASDGVNALGGFGYSALRGEVNVDLSGNVYIASCSSSPDFPTTEGAFQTVKNNGQDAVVVKLNADLSELSWSTFLGSSSNDMAYGLRIKDDQTVMAVGATGGGNDPFPTTEGAYSTDAFGSTDIFVSNLSADGSVLINSTLVGTPQDDNGLFLDLDNNDNVWVYLVSDGTWETTPGVWGVGQGSALVVKLSPDLSALPVVSYLTDQGSPSANPVAFMVDLCNNIYISAFGVSAGGGFVTGDDALFTTGGFYLGVYEPDMEGFVYGTFYSANHVDGGTSRFDKTGIVYQGVCSGGDFNTTPDAYAPDQVGGWDVGVFKIDFEIETVNAVASAAGYLTGCAPHNVILQNFSSTETVEWDFGDGTTSEEFEPTHLYENPGDYIISLIVVDSASCNIRDTAYIPITVLPEVDFFADFSVDFDCETGESFITDNSEGPEDVEYEWNMGDGTLLYEEEPIHIYNDPGVYTITLTLSSDACNQEVVESVDFVFVPSIESDFNLSVIEICDSFMVSFINQTIGAETVEWDFGDGQSSNQPGNFEYEYEEAGNYEVTLIVSNPLSCNITDTLVLPLEIIAPPVLSPVISISQIDLCSELAFQAAVNPNGPVESVLWTLNGDSIANTASFESSVDQSGIYTVEVILTDPVCQDTASTSVQFEFFEELGFSLPPQITLCYYDHSVSLDATVPYPTAIYNWNSGLSSDPVLVVDDGGNYEVEVIHNGCSQIESTNITSGPQFPLSDEVLICENIDNHFTFYDDVTFLESITWEDGQVGNNVVITESGYFSFEALDILGCIQRDSILAIPKDSDPNLVIPNVITPNDDGRNDEFVVQGDSLVFFSLEIYNRWGKPVFSTTDIYGTWDGTYETGSEDNAPENHFMYILKYRNECDRENRVETGNISLLK